MGPELRLIYPPGSSGSDTIIEGVGDLYVYQDDSGVWYIDPSNLTVPATISGGITLSGVNGIETSFIPTGSGTDGYWLIDPEGIEAGITLEYTTVYGTAGSGNGIFWGTAQFMGASGTNIYHNLGNEDHSVFITPDGQDNFDIDATAMIGEIYVKKREEYDTVYTTGSGSQGQWFSWMVVQGWPWNPNVARDSLTFDTTINTTTSGAFLGEGQDTGLEVTVSGGSWAITYDLAYQLSATTTGISAGYIWLEDGMHIVPNSQRHISTLSPSYNDVTQHISVTSFATTTVPKRYRLYASKDLNLTPDEFKLIGTETISGTKSVSSMITIPMSHLGPPASEQYGSYLTTIYGTDGLYSYWNQGAGAWYVQPDYEEFNLYGENGISITAVSGGLYVDGTAVQGTGGGGAGASITGDSYFTTSGTSVEHGLSADHYLTVTPTVSGVDDAAKIGTVWIETASGTDMVYCTGQGDADGLPFMWMATPSGSFETTHDELIVTGSGSFTGYSGTIIDHNLGTLDHSTVITPAGTGDWTTNGLTKIGITYVDIGFNQDTVYNTGGDDSTGQPFNWTASKNSAINLLLEGITPGCLECDGDNLTVAGNITATSGTFTDGLTVGSGTIRITGDSIELPNSPPLTSLDRFYKTIVGGRLEYYSDTEIRWEPYESDTIGLWNGSGWELVCPSGTIQAFNNFTTISGGSASVDTNYDVYAKYVSQEDFTLEFQEWAGDTSRYEDPQRWQGIFVRDLTGEGKKKRWLGSIRLYNDGGLKFKSTFVSNFYNTCIKTVDNYYLNHGSSTSSTSLVYWDNNQNACKCEALHCYTVSVRADGSFQADTNGVFRVYVFDNEATFLNCWSENPYYSTFHVGGWFTSEPGYHEYNIKHKVDSGTTYLARARPRFSWWG